MSESPLCGRRACAAALRAREWRERTAAVPDATHVVRSALSEWASYAWPGILASVSLQPKSRSFAFAPRKEDCRERCRLGEAEAICLLISRQPFWKPKEDLFDSRDAFSTDDLSPADRYACHKINDTHT